MGEVFVLLLGEIDLSVGFVGGDRRRASWPTLVEPGARLAVVGGDRRRPARLRRRSALHPGTDHHPIGLPSFVVTLAGLLFWQGVMLLILGNGGTLPINDNVINDIASSNLTHAASWIVMLVIVGAVRPRVRGGATPSGAARGSSRRRPDHAAQDRRGARGAGVGLVAALQRRTAGIIVPISGVPVGGAARPGRARASGRFLLGRTQFGRYIYAIGGNAEAARRAGINVSAIRTLAFTLTTLTAGIAGIVYASRLRSISTTLDGGTLVLYAVAAAVIGGTSLFGGRGKAMHGVLGGIVIAAIDNGMGLMGYSAPAKYMVTALVLLAAVTIDATSNRGRAST